MFTSRKKQLAKLNTHCDQLLVYIEEYANLKKNLDVSLEKLSRYRGGYQALSSAFSELKLNTLSTAASFSADLFEQDSDDEDLPEQKQMYSKQKKKSSDSDFTSTPMFTHLKSFLSSKESTESVIENQKAFIKTQLKQAITLMNKTALLKDKIKENPLKIDPSVSLKILNLFKIYRDTMPHDPFVKKPALKQKKK